MLTFTNHKRYLKDALKCFSVLGSNGLHDRDKSDNARSADRHTMQGPQAGENEVVIGEWDDKPEHNHHHDGCQISILATLSGNFKRLVDLGIGHIHLGLPRLSRSDGPAVSWLILNTWQR